MSYAKAMKHKPTRAGRMYMGFSSLAPNERRRDPWLGGSWFREGRDDEREEYIAHYHATTERMLKENPALRIID